MKTYARIHDGLIAELFETAGDIKKLFHPSLVWVDVTNESPRPEVGWLHVAGEFESPAQPAPTPEQVAKQYEAATQAHMDAAAVAAGYDDIKNVVTYAEEPAVPKFQADGKAFRRWRSLVWAYAYEQLAAVQAGERDQPTIEEFLAELPVLELPA